MRNGRQLLSRREMIGVLSAATLSADTGNSFVSGNAAYDAAYNSALSVLAGNVRQLAAYTKPVLIEGAEYGGVWLECAPLEGLTYEAFAPDVARNNHEIFFAVQREDGYIPCWVRDQSTGMAQIQMVVPIAATAWELYQRQRDASFLERAYSACARWDRWLAQHRDTRHTGLCEAFCVWDTGMDNSGRFHGVPNACPQGDARICPRVADLPYLAPDLSASVYGGRVALAAMAREIGKSSEETQWRERAEDIRTRILAQLYNPAEGAFYDVNSKDEFVCVRSIAIARVLSEHVPDEKTFEQIWKKQIGNPRAFWAPYPLPSVALDDPTFVRPIPRNSWGGASQALTALRAPRWMDFYARSAELTHLMRQWTTAIVNAREFLQQMDPDTGVFTQAGRAYSPAALVMIDFSARLYGVRKTADGFEWNCRLPEGSDRCRSQVPGAELATDRSGSRLLLKGKEIARVQGEVRVLTDTDGQLTQVIGTSQRYESVQISRGGRSKLIHLAPNQHGALRNS